MRFPHGRLLYFCAAPFLGAFGLTAAASDAWSRALPAHVESLVAEAHPEAMCLAAARAHEAHSRIPRHLLGAIALTESGRWSDGAGRKIAWPWTVTAEGEGRYFDTKLEAVAEVEILLSQDVKNIDVGCMQVNLHHHWDAFGSLSDAFDPLKNTAYAAEFLKRKRTETQTWISAAGRYHSKTPEHYKRYRDKVETHWRLLKRNPFDVAALGSGEFDDGGRTVIEETIIQPLNHPRKQSANGDGAGVAYDLMERLNAGFKANRALLQPKQRRLSRASAPNARNTGLLRTPGHRLQRAIAERRARLAQRQQAKRNSHGAESRPRIASFPERRQSQLNRWRETGLLRGGR